MTWVLSPVAVALWVLSANRLRLSRASSAQALMTATVVSLAANVTLRVPVIWQSLDAMVGGPVAIATKHLLTLSTEALILLFVREIQGRGLARRTIVGITALTALAIVALLAIAGPTEATLTYEGYARLYTSSWPWLSYWSITLAYGIWAFGTGASFYWRYQRRAGRGAEALGFMLIGMGTTIALLITVLKVCVVVSALLGRMSVWDGWAPGMVLPLIAALMLCVVAGLVVMVAASWSRRWGSRRAHCRSATALEPLWRSVTSVVPNITLDHRAMTSLTGTRLSARDRLYRRVIEINDGLLALVPYTSALTWQAALSHAHEAGEPEPQARVVADAVVLHLSLERYRARSQAQHATAHLVTRPSSDFSAEVERLVQLAQTSRSCPLTARITQQMLQMENA